MSWLVVFAITWFYLSILSMWVVLYYLKDLRNYYPEPPWWLGVPPVSFAVSAVVLAFLVY